MSNEAETPEEDALDFEIGCISKFDVGLQRGVITCRSGDEYPFVADDLVGKFKNLQDFPGVYFKISDSKATEISYNPNVNIKHASPRSGFAFTGDAKCPSCDWRLPKLPHAEQAVLRRGKNAPCPKCGTLLSLKSMFIGIHNYLAFGSLASIFIINWIVGRVSVVVDESVLASLGLMQIFSWFVLISLYFYIYIQEKLVPVAEVEVFE